MRVAFSRRLGHRPTIQGTCDQMNALANRRFLKMNGLGNQITVLDLRGSKHIVSEAEARAIASEPRARFGKQLPRAGNIPREHACIVLPRPSHNPSVGPVLHFELRFVTSDDPQVDAAPVQLPRQLAVSIAAGSTVRAPT